MGRGGDGGSRVRKTKKMTLAACEALVRLPGETSAWMPCSKPASAGGRLCSMHRDAVDGAVLGVVAGSSMPEARSWKRQRRSTCPPAAGKRRAADTA